MSELVGADLLRRVLARDESAARELVRALHPLVARIVRAHLPRRVDEEDLQQEVFMKVFAHLPRYESTAPVQHWVSRIAVNTCLNALRHERRRPELRSADLGETHARLLFEQEADPAPASAATARTARELLQHVMSQLKPADRLLINWLELEELSAREVSQRTGWSVPVIKVRAFRARARLRAVLQTLHPDERS
jgi:RNA polymerase sigma-70 factor, ECF subfamily